jgi:hypothetical protein
VATIQVLSPIKNAAPFLPINQQERRVIMLIDIDNSRSIIGDVNAIEIRSAASNDTFIESRYIDFHMTAEAIAYWLTCNVKPTTEANDIALVAQNIEYLTIRKDERTIPVHLYHLENTINSDEMKASGLCMRVTFETRIGLIVSIVNEAWRNMSNRPTIDEI